MLDQEAGELGKSLRSIERGARGMELGVGWVERLFRRWVSLSL